MAQTMQKPFVEAARLAANNDDADQEPIMRTFLSKFSKTLAGIALATTFGVTVAGGAAYADVSAASGHEQAMNRGLDHQQARQIKTPTAAATPEALAKARAHEAAMAKGKDHQDARAAEERAQAAGYSPSAVERAKKHAAEMNKGKDHYAAWDAVRASE
jgi:hypothetical protein